MLIESRVHSTAPIISDKNDVYVYATSGYPARSMLRRINLRNAIYDARTEEKEFDCQPNIILDCITVH